MTPATKALQAASTAAAIASINAVPMAAQSVSSNCVLRSSYSPGAALTRLPHVVFAVSTTSPKAVLIPSTAPVARLFAESQAVLQSPVSSAVKTLAATRTVGMAPFAKSSRLSVTGLTPTIVSRQIAASAPFRLSYWTFRLSAAPSMSERLVWAALRPCTKACPRSSACVPKSATCRRLRSSGSSISLSAAMARPKTSSMVSEPSDRPAKVSAAESPSSSSAALASLVPSWTRTPNSFMASAILSVPSTPPAAPVSIRLKNWSAAKPDCAKRLEYSPIESRKSSLLLRPFWKPAAIRSKAWSGDRSSNSCCSVPAALMTFSIGSSKASEMPKAFLVSFSSWPTTSSMCLDSRATAAPASWTFSA